MAGEGATHLWPAELQLKKFGQHNRACTERMQQRRRSRAANAVNSQSWRQRTCTHRNLPPPHQTPDVREGCCESR